ncbi:bifunctional helix-turn-helix transcriptional regulator/GNAT family N-acetyltransferase [Variovorax sp.]|uniref:bifunctional helix-turn-helix transcriptional regulator/GNAT family N-acetyltransferase n=1 Tax=Variovorax sp. TaxID=1871043 RepID=UPI002D73F535|nr:bifunctional helix-turn-helix transcriptional regulator/GNAT family N-acetyltransferase [Variovorax sp.]HYP85709.1 bifunctional helix-turn-helix transcriptional regulator/GNAT family N-acetyltransferase [Variovorax sp.]
MNAIVAEPAAVAPPAPADPAVKAMRRFNRFYTREIGVLEPYLGSSLSLTEVRVLYELAHRQDLVANDLVRELGLDAGYISRLIGRFEQRGWVQRSTHAGDGRQSVLALTAAGRDTFEPLQQKSREQTAAQLAHLAAPERQRLVQAMETMQTLLAPPAAGAAAATRTVVLRDPVPGDIGWVVQQHGELYAREYGWNMDFEALVADIAARFVRKFQPDWEKCWIAELEGERVGSVFLARKSATTAQLRLLLLAPNARGLGLGGRLTDECIAYARARGYRKIVLWTNSVLAAARHIYAARGFTLEKAEPYEGFGRQLVGETWSLRL